MTDAPPSTATEVKPVGKPELDRLAVEFVARWAWRDSPKLADEERLSAIKWHPIIRAEWDRASPEAIGFEAVYEMVEELRAAGRLEPAGPKRDLYDDAADHLLETASALAAERARADKAEKKLIASRHAHKRAFDIAVAKQERVLTLESANADLVAQIAALREALEPFAAWAARELEKEIPRHIADDPGTPVLASGDYLDPSRREVTVGDLIRAAALAEVTP